MVLNFRNIISKANRTLNFFDFLRDSEHFQVGHLVKSAIALPVHHRCKVRVRSWSASIGQDLVEVPASRVPDVYLGRCSRNFIHL